VKHHGPASLPTVVCISKNPHSCGNEFGTNPLEMAGENKLPVSQKQSESLLRQGIKISTIVYLIFGGFPCGN